MTEATLRPISTAATSPVDTSPHDGRLLLVLPGLAQRHPDGSPWFERQAANGLARWAEHFEGVDVACDVTPWTSASGETHVPIGGLLASGRVRLCELPPLGGLSAATRHRERARARLETAIDAAGWICIAIGHPHYDWGYTAVEAARARGRRFAVWTDRVEHRVVLDEHRDRTGWRRAFRWLRNRLVVSPWLRRLERQAIEQADLGLFHGLDCHTAYAPWSRNPHLVHDIHLGEADQVGDAAFEAKQRHVMAAGEPVELVYAGRAAAMKGGDDWIEALGLLAAAGVAFRATWLGDGPLLASMRERAQALGIGDRVHLPGRIDDRSAVLQALQRADLFVFCHKTPESPRCLIEALMSGTPIVGYHSPYAADLAGPAAAADLVAHDARQLADRVAAHARDRAALAAAQREARERGRAYSDVAVFRHRSELIKAHLHPGAV